MLRIHKLIDQIASGNLTVGYRADLPLAPAPNVRIPSLIEPLITSQKFSLHYSMITDDALHLTGVDLWRAKVLRPPFATTWLEIDLGRYIEGLLVRFDAATETTTADIFTCWSGVWIDHGIQSLLRPDGAPREAMNFLYDEDQYVDFAETKGFAQYAPGHVISTCCLLISKEAELATIAAPAKLNKKRERKGESPLFEHRVITVPGIAKQTAVGEGEHASPRLHWRRGHVRQLSSGLKTAVRPCLVGLAERGFVSKDYIAALDKGAGK